MRNFVVHTPLRGLRRADNLKGPIDAGEVVALPDRVFGSLLAAGAIEPTNAEPTVVLEWLSDAAMERYNAAPISVVAITDRHALIAAIEDLGGIVFFVGEGLPDNAEAVLADFSNDQLLDEVAARIDEARLTPTLLGGLIDLDVAGAENATPPPVEVALEQSLTGAQPGAPAPVPVPQEEPAPEKPVRKAKAAGK